VVRHGSRTVGGYLQFDGNEATTGNQGRMFSWDATYGTALIRGTHRRTTANGADITMEYDGYRVPFGIQYWAALGRLVRCEYEPHSGAAHVELKAIIDGCDALAVGDDRSAASRGTARRSMGRTSTAATAASSST
jgi:hypothetical protein